MSPVTAIWPAVTSPGPVAESCTRLGWSPCMRIATCFTLRTMSVTSSRTPASDENSCSTPSILIAVTAAPCSEDSSTRRSALPSVRPKPRSSGSAMKLALRRLSTLALDFKPVGLLQFGQFLAITATGFTSSLGRNGSSPARPRCIIELEIRAGGTAPAEAQRQTRRRFGGRTPLCGIGVTSRIEVIWKPTACRARSAIHDPNRGP